MLEVVGTGVPFIKEVVCLTGFAIAQQGVHFNVERICPWGFTNKPAGGAVEDGIRLGKRTNRNTDLAGFFISVQINMAVFSIELPLEFVGDIGYGYGF